MLWSLLTSFVLASTSLSSISMVQAATAGAPACVSFDINWNLLAFGFNGKDFNAGQQSTWTDSSALKDITTSGRPPFDSPNTTCYLAQFFNAIYVLNADSANPAAVYIYDIQGAKWSMQQVQTDNTGTQGKNFDPSDFKTILDHDTNVFYSYSKGELYALDMQSMISANSSPIAWKDVQSPDLSSLPDINSVQTPGKGTDGYEPVMALAQNHVHFLGINGIPAGNAKIFVIHFSFMQPTPQFYGTAFPSTHGQAASFFMDQGVQQEFAFIPDDGSQTYVINVETNTTKTLTGPPVKDPFATYSASTTALVQLTSDGQVAFLAYDPKTTTSGGTWASITKLPAISSTSSSSGGSSSSNGSSTASGSGSSASGSGSGPSSSGSSTGGNSSSGNSTHNSAALGLTTSWGVSLMMGIGGGLAALGLGL